MFLVWINTLPEPENLFTSPSPEVKPIMPEATSIWYSSELSQATTCSLSMTSGFSGVTSSSKISPKAYTKISPIPVVSITNKPPVPEKKALEMS